MELGSLRTIIKKIQDNLAHVNEEVRDEFDLYFQIRSFFNFTDTGYMYRVKFKPHNESSTTTIEIVN